MKHGHLNKGYVSIAGAISVPQKTVTPVNTGYTGLHRLHRLHRLTPVNTVTPVNTGLRRLHRLTPACTGYTGYTG